MENNLRKICEVPIIMTFWNSLSLGLTRTSSIFLTVSVFVLFLLFTFWHYSKRPGNVGNHVALRCQNLVSISSQLIIFTQFFKYFLSAGEATNIERYDFFSNVMFRGIRTVTLSFRINLKTGNYKRWSFLQFAQLAVIFVLHQQHKNFNHAVNEALRCIIVYTPPCNRTVRLLSINVWKILWSMLPIGPYGKGQQERRVREYQKLIFPNTSSRIYLEYLFADSWIQRHTVAIFTVGRSFKHELGTDGKTYRLWNRIPRNSIVIV